MIERKMTGNLRIHGVREIHRNADAVDAHVEEIRNLGYTIVGSPAGTHLKNIINYALAEEYHLSPKIDVVGEVIGNTSSTGEGAEGSGPALNLPPEAAGAETSALIGLRYHVTPALFLAVGVTYDNNHAILVRPGITYRFGGR